jgi:hypothetical protein
VTQWFASGVPLKAMFDKAALSDVPNGATSRKAILSNTTKYIYREAQRRGMRGIMNESAAQQLAWINPM